MKDEFLLKIGQAVRFYRLKQELSQEELAFRAELNLNSISTLERGINNIKIKNLQKIAIALNIKLVDIINFAN